MRSASLRFAAAAARSPSRPARAGDESLRGWALHERGTRAGLLGDRAAAAANLSEALRIRRRLGDRAGTAATAHNMRYLGIAPPPVTPRRRPRVRSRRWLALLGVGAALAVAITGAVAYASATATAVTITNVGCGPLPVPAGFFNALPGFDLPSTIGEDGPVRATVPQLPLTVDTTRREAIVVTGPLGLPLAPAIDPGGRLQELIFDDRSLLGNVVPLELGSRSQHTLRIVCRAP
jgi:hypothetical protein